MLLWIWDLEFNIHMIQCVITVLKNIDLLPLGLCSFVVNGLQRTAAVKYTGAYALDGLGQIQYFKRSAVSENTVMDCGDLCRQAHRFQRSAVDEIFVSQR